MYRDPELYQKLVAAFVGAAFLTGVVLAASTGLLQGWRCESQARDEPGRRPARSLPLSRPTQTPAGETSTSGRGPASPAPARGGAPRAAP